MTESQTKRVIAALEAISVELALMNDLTLAEIKLGTGDILVKAAFAAEERHRNAQVD
jgi:hypothetical protein